MRRRPVVTILILLISMILTLPLRGQQKPVTQGPRFGPAAFPSTCAAGTLPAGRPQKPAAPGFTGCGKSPRGARGSAGILPAIAEAKGVAGWKPALPQPSEAFFRGLSSPAKPFTQEQVSNMVRDGFGDDSGAKLLEQRGIDFTPSEDFIQTLKAAGASEAFLNALRAAAAPGLSPAHVDVAASLPRHGGVKPPLRPAALKGGSTTAGPPASAKKPLNQVQVFALLAGQVPSHRASALVNKWSIAPRAN